MIIFINLLFLYTKIKNKYIKHSNNIVKQKENLKIQKIFIF
jgi:hypothetical protein